MSERDDYILARVTVDIASGQDADASVAYWAGYWETLQNAPQLAKDALTKFDLKKASDASTLASS